MRTERSILRSNVRVADTSVMYGALLTHQLLLARRCRFLARSQMGSDLLTLFRREGGREKMLSGLRDVLLSADMGAEAADEVIEELKAVADSATKEVTPEEVRGDDGRTEP